MLMNILIRLLFYYKIYIVKLFFFPLHNLCASVVVFIFLMILDYLRSKILHSNN